MQKLLPVLVFLATASAFSHGSMAVEVRFAAGVSGAGNAVVLVGGMGGGTGGGMGGMTGGGMSGGMGGMSGGMSRFGGTPSNSPGNTYGGVGSSGGGAQPAQYYLCVTPYTAARWLPPPAPSAAVHHARVPPDIAARSNRG